VFYYNKNTEICVVLGCYTAYSDSRYRRFGKTYRFHLQGSRITRKPTFFSGNCDVEIVVLICHQWNNSHNILFEDRNDGRLIGCDPLTHFMAQPIHLNELRKKKGNIFQSDLTQDSIRAHSLPTSSHAVYFLKAFFFCLSSFKNRRYCLLLFFSNFVLTSNCAVVRVFWFSILCFQTHAVGVLSAALFTRKLTPQSSLCVEVVNKL
jgi:hypothetical protein